MSQQGEFVPVEFSAKRAFQLLYEHARNDRLPGDCSCAACGILVIELCDVLEIRPMSASELRAEAERRGWTRSALSPNIS